MSAVYRTACRRAKWTVSSVTQTSTEIDSLFEGIDFYTSLTRADFEELCQDLFRSTLEPVEKVQDQEVVDSRNRPRRWFNSYPRFVKLISDFINDNEPNKSKFEIVAIYANSLLDVLIQVLEVTASAPNTTASLASYELSVTLPTPRDVSQIEVTEFVRYTQPSRTSGRALSPHVDIPFSSPVYHTIEADPFGIPVIFARPPFGFVCSRTCVSSITSIAWLTFVWMTCNLSHNQISLSPHLNYLSVWYNTLIGDPDWTTTDNDACSELPDDLARDGRLGTRFVEPEWGGGGGYTPQVPSLRVLWWAHGHLESLQSSRISLGSRDVMGQNLRLFTQLKSSSHLVPETESGVSQRSMERPFYTEASKETMILTTPPRCMAVTAQTPQLSLYGISADPGPGPFVIIMADPDVPTPQNPSFSPVRHWLAGNYYPTKTSNVLTPSGTAITPYFQPTPGVGSPAHRYTYLLYKQPSNFNQQTIVTPQTSIVNWNHAFPFPICGASIFGAMNPGLLGTGQQECDRMVRSEEHPSCWDYERLQLHPFGPASRTLPGISHQSAVLYVHTKGTFLQSAPRKLGATRKNIRHEAFLANLKPSPIHCRDPLPYSVQETPVGFEEKINIGWRLRAFDPILVVEEGAGGALEETPPTPPSSQSRDVPIIEANAHIWWHRGSSSSLEQIDQGIRLEDGDGWRQEALGVVWPGSWPRAPNSIPVPISHLRPAPRLLVPPAACAGSRMTGKAIPTGPRALLASASSASTSTPASSQAINHSQRPPPTGPSAKRIPTGPRSLQTQYRGTAGPSSRPYNGSGFPAPSMGGGPSAPPNGVDSQTNGRFSSPTMNGKKPELPSPSSSSQVKGMAPDSHPAKGMVRSESQWRHPQSYREHEHAESCDIDFAGEHV
ncbi:hypothetical protein NMY22_g3346 [Coprinellus aureogranulatus]|nr:hypothetical protein NMY22_g3346 [Coprinellus aureogranulatus]